ncbi:MAG: hypothetical protein IPK94_06215 [Saprospiraceae bacterium]|nr:hypothetical protein [Saprospiraceae bacterium]
MHKDILIISYLMVIPEFLKLIFISRQSRSVVNKCRIVIPLLGKSGSEHFYVVDQLQQTCPGRSRYPRL